MKENFWQKVVWSHINLIQKMGIITSLSLTLGGFQENLRMVSCLIFLAKISDWELSNWFAYKKVWLVWLVHTRFFRFLIEQIPKQIFLGPQALQANFLLSPSKLGPLLGAVMKGCTQFLVPTGLLVFYIIIFQIHCYGDIVLNNKRYGQPHYIKQ